MPKTYWTMFITLPLVVNGQAWKKMFISLQAGKKFPPAGQVSLRCGMVSLMYFFIFSLQITKFHGKELPVLPIFSTPGKRVCKDAWCAAHNVTQSRFRKGVKSGKDTKNVIGNKLLLSLLFF